MFANISLARENKLVRAEAKPSPVLTVFLLNLVTGPAQ